MHLSRTRSIVAAIAALFAVVLVASCSSPAPQERSITLTLIRHAESQSNADGVIDTEVPGPSLTSVGEQQAAAVASRLKGNGYDGIYASEMVRTQQTADPMFAGLGGPQQIWMSHRDVVEAPPPGFRVAGWTDTCAVAAMAAPGGVFYCKLREGADLRIGSGPLPHEGQGQAGRRERSPAADESC